MTADGPSLEAAAAAAIRETPIVDLPSLIGVFEAFKKQAEFRLLREAQETTAARQPEPERLLTPEEALGLLGGNVSRRWLLRHTRGRSFRRDHSRKVVRFEERGFRRWASVRPR